jgi:hypothetical protein
MRWMILAAVFLAGCSPRPQVSERALCDGTRASRDAHVAALLADAGPRALVTGQALIAQIDAGCAD